MMYLVSDEHYQILIIGEMLAEANLKKKLKCILLSTNLGSTMASYPQIYWSEVPIQMNEIFYISRYQYSLRL